MEHDDQLLEALKELDQPVTPALQFVARVERQMRAERGGLTEAGPITLHRQTASGRSSRPSRHRWLDIAAAAVLLIGLISGMTSLAPNRSTPGPSAILSPELDPGPILPAPAGDQRFPGPAPTAPDYELLWSTRGRGTVVVSGDTLYRWVPSSDEPRADLNEPRAALIAHDLATGAVRWQVEVTPILPFVVTPEGIVAGVPEETTATPDPEERPAFRLALLSHETGEPIWVAERILAPSLGTVIATEDAVVFASGGDALIEIAAFELATGRERWTHAYPRVLPPGVSAEICYDSRGDCSVRFSYVVWLVSRDGILYVSDSVTLKVVALNANDGSVRWTVDLTQRAKSTTVAYGLPIAVEGGVVVLIDDPTTLDAGAVRYYGLWSAASGEELWTGALNRVDPFAVATDESLFLSHLASGETCCQLAEIALATGEVVWTSESELAAWATGYLAEAGTVVLTSVEGLPRVIGVDVQTHETRWELLLREQGCSSLGLPLGEDGTLVCWSDYGELRVLRPVRQPNVATPGADVVATPADGYATGTLVEVIADGVRLRSEPTLDQDTIMIEYPVGTELQIMEGPITGTDGTIWYRVRNPEAAVSGYLSAEFLAPVEQP